MMQKMVLISKCFIPLKLHQSPQSQIMNPNVLEQTFEIKSYYETDCVLCAFNKTH